MNRFFVKIISANISEYIIMDSKDYKDIESIISFLNFTIDLTIELTNIEESEFFGLIPVNDKITKENLEYLMEDNDRTFDVAKHKTDKDICVYIRAVSSNDDDFQRFMKSITKPPKKGALNKFNRLFAKRYRDKKKAMLKLKKG